MEKWRKKDSGIEVEAVRLNEENAAEVATWCGGVLVEEIDPEHPDETQPGINVPSLQGMQRASLHSYVVKFSRKYFVVAPRVFEMWYTPATRPSPPPESIGDTRHRLGFGEELGGPRII